MKQQEILLQFILEAYGRTNKEQAKIADFIVAESGFNDFASYARIKPNKANKLIDYIEQFDTFEEFATTNELN